MSAEHPNDEPARPSEMNSYRFRRQRNLYTDADTYKRAGKASKLISDEVRRARLGKSFCMFDRNTYSGEGRITREQMLEIGGFMRCEAGFTDDQNKSVVEAMDENNDGIITFSEFLKFNKDVLYELSDEEFERVDKRFLTLAQEVQRAKSGSGDPLEDSDWYMFGSENSGMQALRRQRNQRPSGTTPPRRSGLTEYEKRQLQARGDLPKEGSNLGPRRSGYEEGEEDLQANRVWMPGTPISRASDCFTALPKKPSSREMSAGFDESFSRYRLRPGSAAPAPLGPDWSTTDDNHHHLRRFHGPERAEIEAAVVEHQDPYVYGYRQPHTNFTIKQDTGPVFEPIQSDLTSDVLDRNAWLEAHSRGKIRDFKVVDMARPVRFHGQIEEGPPHDAPYWMTGRSARF